jgi:hypothetical protein
MMAGATALPISVQGLEIPRDQIEIEVYKRGEGIHIGYSRADRKGLAVENFHARIKAQFPESLSVTLGIQKQKKKWDLTRRLEEITASSFGDQYGPPWNVNLTAQERSLEEVGDLHGSVIEGTHTMGWNLSNSGSSDVCTTSSSQNHKFHAKRSRSSCLLRLESRMASQTDISADGGTLRGPPAEMFIIIIIGI